jgi:hypothetical protein
MGSFTAVTLSIQIATCEYITAFRSIWLRPGRDKAILKRQLEPKDHASSLQANVKLERNVFPETQIDHHGTIWGARAGLIHRKDGRNMKPTNMLILQTGLQPNTFRHMS